MKAWQLAAFQDIGAMKLVDAPEPKAGEGEVVLDLEMAALNPADRFLAMGQYPASPPLPHVLGRDGVGIVRSLGAGVKQFHVGQRLVILRGETGVTRWGTFARQVAVSADSLTAPPPGWSLEESSCASLVYLTAYQALTMWGELPPSVVLITGASGGVGIASLQLGKAMGHTVVSLSRSEEKRQTLRRLGADFTFDPSDKQWPRQLKEALPQRVDLAIDNVAGPLLEPVISAMCEHGRVSLVGRSGGAVPEFNTASLFFRRIRLGGVSVGAYKPHESQAAWKDVVELLQKTGARPQIDKIFPFDQLPQAFEHLKRGPMGKVLLDVG